MFDYLQKFNQLDKALRDRVSSPAVMEKINRLEKEYGVSLAAVVMRIMVKEIALIDLAKFFVEEQNLEAKKAEKLSQEMRDGIFSPVKDYLEQRDLPLSEEVMEPEVKGASFFFTPEDEEEIRNLSVKIDEKIKQAGPEEKVEENIEKILAEAQINFGSQELLNRFKSILKTFLRGIRDKIETKQTLKKTFADGGLGFDSVSADKIMEITESVRQGEKTSLRPPVKINLPEDINAGSRGKVGFKNIGLRDVDYNFASLAPKEKNSSSPIKKEVILDVTHELAPLTPAVVVKSVPSDLSAPTFSPRREKVSLSKPAPINYEAKKIITAKPQFRSPNEASGKTRMEDVKHISPKVMNPIDELVYLDLVNFRRLASDPEAQASKVKEKITLLQEEQYSKRADGINAWRQSPVYRLYLAIGQSSISENKPIETIIDERNNRQEDYLSFEEFNAIMDLNKELRF